MSQTIRAQLTSDPRVVIIDSYAMSMSVRSGHLVIKSRQTERVISRHECGKRNDGIARIIILSRVGSITLEALNWCAALSLPVIQVNRDGSSVMGSPGPVSTDARLYKQQILAQPGMPAQHTGLAVMRDLITAKITGQLETLRFMNRDTQRIAGCVAQMANASDVRSMLGIEGNAAIAYWQAWEDKVFVPWDLDALKYIPSHWCTFTGRATLTRGHGYAESSNRNATDFVNACLNYAYKIAETEAMFACHTVGLHPALGLSHGAIHEDKPAMTLDLLEPLRPIADRIVLSYLDYGRGIPLTEDGKLAYLDRDCAYELENGQCRLFPPMTSRLASAVSMAVAEPVMRYAQVIAKSLAATAHISIMAPLDPRIKPRDTTVVLSADITLQDLIPDHTWATVQEIIPQVPAGIGRRSDVRALLACIMAHEIYRVSWPKAAAQFHCDFRTARRRLEEWQATGIWDAVLAEVTRPGVSQRQAV